MPSLADLPELVGFFSYSRQDDEDSKGTLSELRDRIERELRGQLGRSRSQFRLWQDKEAISPGTLWESEIKTAINQSTFFIPIVTPTAVNSSQCKTEFESFLERESALGRADLIFPILYIRVPALDSEEHWRSHPVLNVIGIRQYVDWRALRHLDVNSTEVKKQVEWFCDKIAATLHQPWISPEERAAKQNTIIRTSDEKNGQEAQSRYVQSGRRAAEAHALQRVTYGTNRQEYETRHQIEERSLRTDQVLQRATEADSSRRSRPPATKDATPQADQASAIHPFKARGLAITLGALFCLGIVSTSAMVWYQLASRTSVSPAAAPPPSPSPAPQPSPSPSPAPSPSPSAAPSPSPPPVTPPSPSGSPICGAQAVQKQIIDIVNGGVGREWGLPSKPLPLFAFEDMGLEKGIRKCATRWSDVKIEYDVAANGTVRITGLYADTSTSPSAPPPSRSGPPTCDTQAVQKQIIDIVKGGVGAEWGLASKPLPLFAFEDKGVEKSVRKCLTRWSDVKIEYDVAANGSVRITGLYRA
jgi:hypothetical protein